MIKMDSHQAISKRDDHLRSDLLLNPQSQKIDDESSDQHSHLSRHSVPESRKSSMTSIWSATVERGWWWWWEIGAMLLSIGCTCLIAAVLFILENKPLQQWTHKHSISPNAVISILSTVAKTAMLLPVTVCISQLKWSYFERPRNLVDIKEFSNASRGPWGAFTFLLKIAVRGQGHLASIGALVMIVALAFEPFSQQILTYPIRPTSYSSEEARIASARQWNSTDLTSNSHQQMLVVQNKLASGITGDFGKLSFACAASNCTFPDLTSLSVCGSCQDVTTQVNQSCETISIYGIGDTELLCTFAPRIPHVELVSMIVDYDEGSEYGTPFGMNSTYVRSEVAPLSPIFNISVANISTPTSIGSDGKTFKLGRVEVSVCEIRFCQTKYANVNAINGELSYTATETALYQVNTEPSSGIGLATSPGGDAEYFVDSGTLFSIWDALNNMFQGTANHATDYDYKNQYVLYIAAKKLDDVIDNLARALTNLIQSLDNTAVEQVKGRSSRIETYVYAQWAWLTLPLCLEIVSLVLLIASILLSNTRPANQLLKDSPLPLVFAGIEEYDVESVEIDKGNAGGYEEAAGKLRVKLVTPQGRPVKFIKAA